VSDCTNRSNSCACPRAFSASAGRASFSSATMVFSSAIKFSGSRARTLSPYRAILSTSFVSIASRNRILSISGRCGVEGYFTRYASSSRINPCGLLAESVSALRSSSSAGFGAGGFWARSGAQNRPERPRVSLLSLRSLTLLRASALALTLLAAGPAPGAEPPPAPAPTAPTTPSASAVADAEIDEHVAQGHRLYQLGRYQEAIAEYRRAYELRADPSFLFQIAESYRQLGATEQALFYYDRYLAGAADGSDRDTAEQRVGELESLRARPPVSATPPGLIAAPGAGAGARTPTPVWRRWWVWTAVGAALAVGVTVAALAGRSQTSVPTTDLGNKKFF